MSNVEIRYRMLSQGRKQMERVRWHAVQKGFLRNELEVAGSIKVDRNLSESFNKRLRRLFPWQSEKSFFLSQYSNQITSKWSTKNTFPIFETLVDVYRTDIDWHQDPKTQNSWPLIFSGSVDIRDATKVGEVDYVWRVNRCQHFIKLAQLSYLLNEPGEEKLVLKLMKSWITKNPYLTGVNWTSPMEIAIRCISWVTSLAYLSQERNLSSEFLQSVLESLVLQTEYVYSHLSRHSSANNHLIVELTGLITCGLIFKNYYIGTKWFERGLNELNQEIEKQIHSDGVLKEQAIHYHSLVLDCLLWVMVLLQHQEIEVPNLLSNRAEKMCNYIAAVIDCKGNVPAIGDSDDGYLLWLANMAELNNYRSQLATGAVLFNRPDFKTRALDFDEKSFWLLGSEGLERFRQMDTPPRDSESLAFPQGGYYVLKCGQGEREKYLLFDCGPLGYPSTAAHGHADALSIWISIGGLPVLIDSGTYSYLSEPKFREFFKGTNAHNTVVVNSLDQSQSGGPYIWLRKASARCEAQFTSPQFDYVAGSHDGYSQNHGVIHQRRILFAKPSYWIVEDCFDSKRSFKWEAYFHFPLGQPKTEEKETFHSYEFFNCNKRFGLRVILPAFRDIQIRILQGSKSPIQGWVSPRYGIKLPCTVLAFGAAAGGDYRINYLLIPTTEQIENNLQIISKILPSKETSFFARCNSFTIRTKNYQDSVFFIDDPDVMLKIGGLTIRGDSIVIREDQNGFVQSLFIIAPTELRINNKSLKNKFRKNSICHLQSSDLNTSTIDLSPIGLNSSIELQRNEAFLFQRNGSDYPA